MESLGGVLAAAPTAVSWAPIRIDVFAAGPGNMPWHWWWDGARWTGPAPLPAGANIPAVGIAAVSLGPNRLDVFAAGAGNTPWWWHWNGTDWDPIPKPLPAGANLPAVTVAATSSGPNFLDVFAAGAGNTPWWWHFNGSTWGAPLPLPATANLPAEGIAAISPKQGRLDVFAVGAQNHLWHWWHTGGSAWNSEDLLGNLPAEGVSVVSSAANRMDVFGASRGGFGGSNPLQHWWWDGVQFQGPENVPGDLTPAAVGPVITGSGRVDVFGVSGNANLTRWQVNGQTWIGPLALGGSLPAGDVSAVVPVLGRIDVFARGSDNTLQHWLELKPPPPPPVDTTGHLTYIKVSDGLRKDLNFAQFELLDAKGTKTLFEFGPSASPEDWIIRAAELAVLREALVRKLTVIVTHEPASSAPIVVKVMAPP